RLGFRELARPYFPEPTGIASVMPVKFLVEFVARPPNFGSVQNDHMITEVNERRELFAIFPAQQRRHARGQPPQNLILGIHYKPLWLNLTLTRDIRAHPQITSYTQ